MAYSAYLPALEEITQLRKPAFAFDAAEPKAQYWVRHGVVFFGDVPVQGADSTSFSCYMTGYAVDARRVYRDGQWDRKLSAESFRCYSFAYHGDHASIRTRFGGEIKGADASSFVALDTGYSEIPGGEIPFILESTGYGKDHLRVYWCQGGAKGMHVAKANPSTFRAFSSTFGHDDQHVFSGRSALPKADPRTWRRIAGAYSTDERRVYYFNRPVPDADPSTFQVFPNRIDMLTFARDKERFYRWDSVITRTEYEDAHR
jgi:hypothetical protein